ncbi:MAG TPA: hypothetical protein VKA47_08525 [Solirubrobacterales bacterium]|nr:hypothetical protein [Solirubrobacterales bacterium]
MERAQIRDLRMPWFAIAFAVMALTAGALAPVAMAGSPSQDQYGQPLPGVGGGGSANDTSGSSPSGTGDTTIPVAPPSGSASDISAGSGTQSSGENAGSGTQSGGGNSGSSDGGSKSHKSDASPTSTTPSSGLNADNRAHAVPQIAADSAGDSWVPFFIAALVALGACVAAVAYRNRRRTAQR